MTIKLEREIFVAFLIRGKECGSRSHLHRCNYDINGWCVRNKYSVFLNGELPFAYYHIYRSKLTKIIYSRNSSVEVSIKDPFCPNWGSGSTCVKDFFEISQPENEIIYHNTNKIPFGNGIYNCLFYWNTDKKEDIEIIHLLLKKENIASYTIYKNKVEIETIHL